MTNAAGAIAGAPATRLLLVEDDARLATAVRSWLGLGGITVDWVAAGLDAETALRGHDYDWMVLDLGLPDVDGERLLAGLRADAYALPVIVVTAREQVLDRVRLLDLGADDFLVKPVHLDELAARLRAIQRRSAGPARPEATLRHGALRLTMSSRSVAVDGKPVPLTPREFGVLEILLRHKGQVLSRERIGENLLGWLDTGVANAVDVHVHHLRRKLGNELITTVRGQGYTIAAEN